MYKRGSQKHAKHYQFIKQKVGKDVIITGQGCATLGAAPMQLHGLGDAAEAERVSAARHIRFLYKLEANRAEEVAVLQHAIINIGGHFT